MNQPIAAPLNDSSRIGQIVRDAIALTKPRVISLLLLTMIMAMFITPAGLPSARLVLVAGLAGFLMAAGANVVNMAYDADIDTLMGVRTRKRPIPSGRVSVQTAYIYGFTLAMISFVMFVLLINLAAAAWAVVGFVYYTLLYTRWLKRRTTQNIVIGGGAGAIPPMIGYAAACGYVDITALMLFVLIFLWTPPHFWALAIMIKKDYANAHVPMLPVVSGDVETSRQIWLYSWVMVAMSLVFVALGVSGWIYLLIALAAGALFVARAWQLRQTTDIPHALKLYKYSLLYLALVFAGLAADKIILRSV